MAMQALARPGNLLLVILVATLLAGASWLAGSQPWAGPGPALNLLGRLAGAAGMTLMLLAAAVSVRVPGFDQPFGGLTDLWKTHHLLGGGAFLLLMAHPLLLALSALTTAPHAASLVLLPAASNIASWLGWGALLAMMVFLAPTFAFFGQLRYQRWKALHALSALAVVLGFAHTLMSARTLPSWIWWVLGAVAILALCYRLGYRKLRPGHAFTVAAVTPLAPRVVELTLEPADREPLQHDPGQFVYLAPLDPGLANGIGEEHPYTISSAPGTPMRIGIKSLGDASDALQTIATSTTALIDGPYGRFFEPGEATAEIWIGGGIGITPFIGRARAFTPGEQADIHLIYCANDPDRAYYLRDLQDIACAVPGFRIWPHYFEDNGPLEAGWVTARCPDIKDRKTYICGPLPLIDIAVRLCRISSVPAYRIRTEEFSLL